MSGIPHFYHKIPNAYNKVINKKPCHIVSVPFGPFRHYGLISDQYVSGSPYIFSCSSRAGQVAEEPAHIFAGGQEIKIHGFQSALNYIQVIDRARSRIGTKYNLLRWNCEHYVRWVHNLKAESPQLKKTSALGLFLLGITFTLRK
ncbi:MAG: lecithin retinol acyltransferase family protein [Candidatus Thiodiazotropha sp.]